MNIHAACAVSKCNLMILADSFGNELQQRLLGSWNKQ